MGKIVDFLQSIPELFLLIALIVVLRLTSSYLKYRQSLFEQTARLHIHRLLGQEIPQKLSRIPYELFEVNSKQICFIL